MNFAHPELLWALVALAIPLIVHFFYLRRSKRYEFSQVELVEQLRRASKPYLRLRHLILLLIRLAFVVAVVLLFAGPYIGKALPTPEQGASVLVVWDVSPSMRPAFETARALLREALRQDPATYEYRLLCTDSYLPRGGFVSRKVLEEKLLGVSPADMGYPLSALLEKAPLLYEGALYTRRKVYIVSDFQRSSVGDLSRIPVSEVGEVVLLPVRGEEGDNAFIDSLSTQWMGGHWKVAFRLQAPVGRTYSLQIGSSRRLLSAGQYEEKIVDKEPFVRIQIEGDRRTFDNEVYVGLSAPQTEPGAWIGWKGPEQSRRAFTRLHALLGLPIWSGEGPFPRATLRVLVCSLNEIPPEVPEWVAQGGTLIAFPPPQTSAAFWQKLFLAQEVTWTGEKVSVQVPIPVIPRNEAFWAPVFVEGSKTSEPTFLAEPLQVEYAYAFLPKAGRLLLEGEKAGPLLWEIPWGKGRIYLFSSPWEAMSMGDHSLFVPLFARLYGERKREETGLAWLGKRNTFSLVGEEEARPVLKHIATGREYIPSLERQLSEIRFSIGEEPIPAGLYEIIWGKQRRYLGVQVPIAESMDSVLSIEAWETAGIPVIVRKWETGNLTMERSGWVWRSWWLWLFIALLLIGLETFWARRLLRPAALVRTA